MKALKRLVCAALSLVLMTAAVGCDKKDNDGEKEQMPEVMSEDFVTAESIGVQAGDKNCEKKINEALAEGKSIYFGSGSYYFSDSINLKSAQLIGDGSTRTSLIATTDKPLIKADGCFKVMDLGVQNNTVTGKEKMGERVLFLLGTNGGVTDGAFIGSVNFGSCGTGVYEPADATPSNGLSIETTEFSKVYFAGFDFMSKGRKNNRISNSYIGAIGTRLEGTPLAGARFSGSEEGLILDQINVEHFSAESSLIFEGIKNLDVSSIHIEGMNIAKAGNGYVECSNTSGNIDNIVVYWSRVEHPNSCCLYLGEADKTGNDLFVGAIQFKGVNDPADFHGSWPIRGIKDNGYLIVNRKPGSKNDYRLTLDSYIPFTYQKDWETLCAFPCNEDDVIYLKKGYIKEAGTTAERPTQRLCKGYSKYYDTTLNKLLVWNGKDWSPAIEANIE